MVIGLGASYTPSLLPKPEKENLVIAGKLGPEPEILANMYKILIEENTDMTVTVKPNFGKTTFLFEALEKGILLSIQSLQGPWPKVSSKPAPQVGHDPEAVYRAARDGIKKQDDLALLKPMVYQEYLCCRGA